jgi:hypothetical protein
MKSDIGSDMSELYIKDWFGRILKCEDKMANDE